jgi:rhamnogalacturonyl hydrolase YesR
MVRDIVLRQSSDGRLCNIEDTPAVVDSSFSIESVIYTAKTQGKDNYARAVEKNIAYLLNDAPRSSGGILYHIDGTQEIWADSAAFMPGALAMTGHPQEGIKQMRGIMEVLKDKETGLYFHMWDDSVMNYKRKLLWGVGNTWILTGLLRLYKQIPSELSEDKNWAVTQFKLLLDTIVKYEAKSCLYYDILDDPESFLETECSEMVAYAIYRGVIEGMLDKSYLARADGIRAAVCEKVSYDGFVQDCASSPDFLKPGTSVEGQAHFLMMEYYAQQQE